MIFLEAAYLLNFFGAPIIDITELEKIEQGSTGLVNYAVPILVFLVIVEAVYAWRMKQKVYTFKDTLGSFLSGSGSILVNVLLKAILIYGAVQIYNLVPWRMAFSWWTLLPCILIYDFCSYWSHRISHFNRFFWATHIVHHSSEDYNLTVSFRQSWMQHIKIIFFLPIAFLGFHPVIFFIANQISVLFQFWQHTEYIRKLHPAIEYIIATPSNHRVHHGSDEKYIDKNFSAIFIFWDRMFGTYQPEEEKPTYGITTKLKHKANPFYLNFHEYKDILADVKCAKGVRKKLFYLFGSPTRIARRKKQEADMATDKPL